MNFENLPDGWELTSLGQLGNWSSGGTPSRREPQYYGGSIPWVKTGNLPDGLILEIDEYITEEGLKNSSAKIFPEDTLLMAMYGATIGKLGILQFPATSNQACAALIAQGITKELIPYVFYFLKSSREDLKKIGKGGAQPNISQTIIKNVPIPLAPLNEQKRIVKKVEALSSHVRRSQEALEEVPQLIEQFRQSVLAAAFRGDLTADWRKQNPDVEPASVLLERIKEERRRKWEEAELEKMRAKGKEPKNDKWKSKYKEVYLEKSIPSLPTWIETSALNACSIVVDCHNKTAPYKSSGIKLVRTSNIRNGLLDTKNVKYVDQETYEYWSKRCIPLSGDLLFTREAPMAEVAKIPDGEQICMGQRMMLLRADNVNLLTDYLLFMLQAPFIKEYVQNTAIGTGVKHLRVRDVENIPVKIPPYLEQIQISQKIADYFKVILHIENELKASELDLNELSQSILAKAFRGELVPQDPNDEPAAVLLERIRAEQEKLKPKKKQKSDRRKKKTVS